MNDGMMEWCCNRYRLLYAESIPFLGVEGLPLKNSRRRTKLFSVVVGCRPVQNNQVRSAGMMEDVRVSPNSTPMASAPTVMYFSSLQTHKLSVSFRRQTPRGTREPDATSPGNTILGSTVASIDLSSPGALSNG